MSGKSSLAVIRDESEWRRCLAESIRDPDVLIDRLELPECWREPARRAARHFPLLVPQSYLERMRLGDPADPLLRQILPLEAEMTATPGFTDDPVGDLAARATPGLVCKYHGRALLVATGACAVHCRYCFRRQYPYGAEPKRLEDWKPALRLLRSDQTLREVILSGGDPLMLSDHRLAQLVGQLEAIPQLSRLRLHTRLPIVLPDRITSALLEMLTETRLTSIVVVHANHPQELAADGAAALRAMVRSGLTVLNQAVLLRKVNDDADTLTELCQRLADLGVIPYYLHQLDRVTGAAHFEVDPSQGKALVEELRRRLPGYAVPRYVREVPGATYKCPLI